MMSTLSQEKIKGMLVDNGIAYKDSGGYHIDYMENQQVKTLDMDVTAIYRVYVFDEHIDKLSVKFSSDITLDHIKSYKVNHLSPTLLVLSLYLK